MSEAVYIEVGASTLLRTIDVAAFVSKRGLEFCARVWPENKIHLPIVFESPTDGARLSFTTAGLSWRELSQAVRLHRLELCTF